MSQGTLFVNAKTRGVAPVAIVNYFKLDVKISNTEDPAYIENFPLKKIPAFIGPKGVKLHEVIAILVYLVSVHDEESPLLGKTKAEFPLVLKWLSFANSDLLPVAASAFNSLLGNIPYNKKAVDTALQSVDKFAAVFETRLSEFTYLVGERITLADIYVATVMGRLFETIWAKDFIKAHPGIYRWFLLITSSDFLSSSRFGKLEFRDKPVEFTPPKKEKKAQAPKAEKPKAEKPKAAEEPAPVEEKKAKHPLEALGKPNMALDEWKRVYSNEETRETALPWFWEHYDPSEWSLYKVGFKYNDELTLTFMSNNLVGGFFNRLSASTKYLFGCLVVYGENNNNGIVGAFLVRGQDFAPAFDVAPDWESYEYSKLDPTSEEDKEFVNNMWAWDKPVIVNGESREIADGKVFK